MNFFISYRFTGEDLQRLDKVMHRLCDIVIEAGYEPICIFWKEDFFQKERFTRKQIFEYALKELDKADAVLAYVDSDNKSAGMMLEVGYGLARGKKIILAIKKGVIAETLRAMADVVMEFKNLEEIQNKLPQIAAV